MRSGRRIVVAGDSSENTGGRALDPAKKSILNMNKIKIFRSSGKIIVLVSVVAAVFAPRVGTAGNYLCSVGPPALRFQSFSHYEKTDTAPTRYSLADSRPVKIVQQPSEPPADSAKSPALPAITMPAAANANSSTALGKDSATPYAGPSVTNIMVVTPEMLDSYFQPSSTQNGGPPSAPAKLGFMPPMPVSDHSSRAVYKVQ